MAIGAPKVRTVVIGVGKAGEDGVVPLDFPVFDHGAIEHPTLGGGEEEHAKGDGRAGTDKGKQGEGDELGQGRAQVGGEVTVGPNGGEALEDEKAERPECGVGEEEETKKVGEGVH